MHRIKNHSIWNTICGEIREQNKKRNSVSKRENRTKFLNIKLIFALKLKSNVIGRMSRKKTRNLTQNHAKKDPINYWIKAFYFAF